MIDQQGRKRIIICDECDDDFEAFDRDDFNTMISAAAGAGWQIRPDNSGHWTHRCPDCSGSHESPLARAKRMFGR